MRRLGLRVAPAEGESLPGFILRLAARAGFRNACEFAVLAGVRQPGGAVSGASLLPLATFSGVAQECLDLMAYPPAGPRGHHRFLEGMVHRDFIWLAARRACPACLREAPHHRGEWDFALATACLRHRHRLLVSCSLCGAEPGWDYPSVGGCQCRARFRDAAIRPAPDEEIAALAFLRSVIREGPPPSLHQDFAGCGPSDLFRITLSLGASAEGWDGHRRVASVVRAGPERVAAIVTAGVQALQDWPTSVCDLHRRGCRLPEDRPRRTPALNLLHKLVHKAVAAGRGQH